LKEVFGKTLGFSLHSRILKGILQETLRFLHHLMGSTFTEVSAAKFLPIMGFFERFF
jgi:hypothetical protein